MGLMSLLDSIIAAGLSPPVCEDSCCGGAREGSHSDVWFWPETVAEFHSGVWFWFGTGWAESVKLFVESAEVLTVSKHGEVLDRPVLLRPVVAAPCVTASKSGSTGEGGWFWFRILSKHVPPELGLPMMELGTKEWSW